MNLADHAKWQKCCVFILLTLLSQIYCTVGFKQIQDHKCLGENLDTWKYWKVLFCQSNNCLILTDDDADEKIAWDRATWCIQTCPNIQLD